MHLAKKVSLQETLGFTDTITPLFYYAVKNPSTVLKNATSHLLAQPGELGQVFQSPLLYIICQMSSRPSHCMSHMRSFYQI